MLSRNRSRVAVPENPSSRGRRALMGVAEVENQMRSIIFVALAVMANLIGSGGAAAQPAPILEYTFDDQVNPTSNSGSLAPAYNGALLGQATFAPFGAGSAVLLNGDVFNNSVVIPINGDNAVFNIADSDFSLFARFTTSYSNIALPRGRGLIWKQFTGPSAGYALAVRQETGRAQFTIQDGVTSPTLFSSCIVNDGAVHEIWGTRCGDVMRLYVDGRLDGTLVLPGNFGSANNNESLVIGGRTIGSGSDDWVGLIDEVRVYDQCIQPIPADECTFKPDQVLCDVTKAGDLTGDFVVTGIFTNLQDIPGTHLLLPPNTVSPPGVQLCFGNGSNSLPLGTPLNNGDSYEIGQDLANDDAIIIKNAMPGDEVCFRLNLMSGLGEECCSICICLLMPPCDCFQIDHRYDEIVIDDDSDCLFNISFDYHFRLTNLFGQDVYHAFVSEITPETFSPDYFDLAMLNGGPLGQGQSMSLWLNFSEVTPGQPIHFLLTIHNEDFSECCTREVWFEAPVCIIDLLKGDMNGDGVVDLLDVAPFVNVITSGSFDPAADINMDGVVNLLDVGPFVEILTGG